jgi:hypothetical protein
MLQTIPKVLAERRGLVALPALARVDHQDQQAPARPLAAWPVPVTTRRVTEQAPAVPAVGPAVRARLVTVLVLAAALQAAIAAMLAVGRSTHVAPCS